jgi:hypothetical protein
LWEPLLLLLLLLVVQTQQAVALRWHLAVCHASVLRQLLLQAS